MHAVARTLLAFSALAATGAHAQTIYKCPGPNGTSVYSQLPCANAGGKQQELKLKGSVTATQSTDADQARKTQAKQEELNRQLDSEEAKCLAPIDGLLREAQDRIAGAEARIRALGYQSSKNSVDAAAEARANEEIDGLQKDIALDRDHATSQEAQIRQTCTEERRAKEAASKEEPAAAPNPDTDPAQAPAPETPAETPPVQ